jgi:hypothetical protein
MRVAEAILHRSFLEGRTAIELVEGETALQVAAADCDGPILISRWRSMFATSARKMPRWCAIRGTRYNSDGGSGLWLPHLPDLLAKCKLVPLKKDDLPKDAEKVRET